MFRTKDVAYMSYSFKTYCVAQLQKLNVKNPRGKKEIVQYVYTDDNDQPGPLEYILFKMDGACFEAYYQPMRGFCSFRQNY